MYEKYLLKLEEAGMLKHLWKIDICVCKTCGGHMGATKQHSFMRD